MGALQAEKMTRVEIEFPQKRLDEVTRILASDGAFQIEDLSSLNMRKENKFDDELLERSAQFAKLEVDLKKSMEQLKIKPSRIPNSALTAVSDPAILKESHDKIQQEISALDAKLVEIDEKLTTEKNYLNITSPFEDLDIDFSSIRNRRYIYSILGIMPVDKVKRFEDSLAKIPHVVLPLHKDTEKATVLLLGPHQQRDFLLHAARSAYLNSLDLPDSFEGTPKEIISRARANIAALEHEQKDGQTRLEALRSQETGTLNQLYWQVRLSRMMYEIIGRFGKLKNDYLVAGWVPERIQKQLAKKVDELGEDVIVNLLPDNDLDSSLLPPVALHHPAELLGFQKLVTTYSMPGYREIDPTVIIAVLFPLLFGAMFGDLGQGVLLALAGFLIFRSKSSRFQRFKALGPVIVLSGLSAAIFGWLYGSFFGFEEVIAPLWKHPINHIMDILIITFSGGALILTLANLLSILNDLRQKDWAHAFFSGKGLAGLLLYWSLLLVIIQSMLKRSFVSFVILEALIVLCLLFILAADALGRLITRKRPVFEGGFFLYFITAFFELFETLLGFLSNSLSFVRVGAFAVAHAGLSSVFMLLAEMVSPNKGLAFWLVIVFGNLFIIGFEGMIVSIQTLRLQYYEFFSKFFKGGGLRYKPLTFNNNPRQGV
ncbi:MAG: V-type ATPase 116kDa subunit family protein [Anaerolineaceae bacterium]|nr:V-type ATPase 116kDa subunit family protein [Anaerolineaceae bacterium]